jgi:3-hydroxymyristoyl/3-hydroxydecanoyl-(acyl carrier protein) dehydratase
MNSPATSLLPQSPEIEYNGGSVRVSFAIPGTYFFCDGHFPGRPLLPGAVLAAWMHEAARLAGLPETARLAKNIKFRAPIAPGDPVTVIATPASSGFQVTLLSRERLCSEALFFA